MPQSWIPAQQNSFLETFAQAEQLKAQRAQNAFNEAKIAELPHERERAEALNAQKIKASEAQAGKAEADTQGSQLENSLKRVELGAQLLSGVRDEGSYQWAKKRAVAIGLPIDNLPETYDPAFVQQTLQTGMKVRDQLTHQLNEQKFTEQQKQSGIDNDFQQKSHNVAQGNLDQRIHHDTVMENKPQAGFSMTTNPDGTATMSYGTPAKNELEKKVIGEEDALARLDEIEKSANSQNLTYQNQAKNALLDIKGKLGGQMSPEQQEFRNSMTDTRQSTLTNASQTIKDLTGSAMGVTEAERIMATLPNMDDAPDVFDRKLQNTIRLTREAIARHKGALGAGAAPQSEPSVTTKDLEYTAAKHGITIEEVKRRMGAAR